MRAHKASPSPGTERSDGSDIEEEIGSGSHERGVNYVIGWFKRGRVQSTKNLRSFRDVVSTREVVALIHYVSERGMDPDAKIIGPLHNALAKYKEAETSEDRIIWTNEVLVGYSELCGITYPQHSINGRTLRDSMLSTWYMKSVIAWGLLLVVAALSVHYVEHWSRNLGGAQDLQTWQALLLFIGKTDSVQIVPLFYGGLGACIYLLRSLSKKAADGMFDARKLQGVGARVFLGAIFGFIVVNLLFHASASGRVLFLETFGLEDLQRNAVAFFCGLGVKAIYGVFARVVDMVHDRVVKPGT